MIVAEMLRQRADPYLRIDQNGDPVADREKRVEIVRQVAGDDEHVDGELLDPRADERNDLGVMLDMKIAGQGKAAPDGAAPSAPATPGTGQPAAPR